ncbi:MAG: hypothetical protein JWN27_2891 [Candidatus Eremiobacteraeota bacterium]|nr:hypothetical protein [Candidatus Eremiobacteraeota bacterium]
MAHYELMPEQVMHGITLGQVLVMFDAAGRYIVTTNPMGGGDTESAGSTAASAEPANSVGTDLAGDAAFVERHQGMTFGAKSIDQMPAHVRELLGR